MRLLSLVRGRSSSPSLAQGLVVSWCGMRGLVTLAIALALPASFPARDLIVLSAFAVVLGMLVIQGLTVGPLIRWLRFERDDSFLRELSSARAALLDAAIASLGSNMKQPHACAMRIVRSAPWFPTGVHPRALMEVDQLRRQSIFAKREQLAELRRSGQIDDDVFHALEQELDWAELAASPPERLELVEG